MPNSLKTRHESASVTDNGLQQVLCKFFGTIADALTVAGCAALVLVVIYAAFHTFLTHKAAR